MDRRSAVAVALLALGVVLCGVAVATAPPLGQTAHRLTVVSADGPPNASDAAALHYENLSASGQALFRRALASEDGTATVYGSSSAPPAFTFVDDHATAGRGLYYVEYHGDWYFVTASVDSGLPAGSLSSLALGAVGLFLLVTGAVGLRTARERLWQ
ncbi:hypothetical protein [Halospeciosus flavus]|uniref:DUF7979 domain-containing protein n=1 Tax=Halospeciosus flavus TaxID=3032283 RepID=A0ABD5Z8L5_9EURY|nr:hypothetical protein [Halospeciosus flavus]